MLSWIFRALRLGGVLTSPQAAPSGLQMTPPSHLGTENPRKPSSPDFILIVLADFQMNLPIPLTGVFRSKLRGDFIACKCSFYQQLLEYWFQLYSVEPENVRDIFEEPLWLNTNIVVGGYPIFYRKWWENDIKYICDICSVDGTIMRKTELESTFSIVVDQMEYNSVVSTIPNRWRKLIKNQSVSFNDKEIYVHLNGMKKSVDKLKCREIYRFFDQQN